MLLKLLITLLFFGSFAPNVASSLDVCPFKPAECSCIQTIYVTIECKKSQTDVSSFMSEIEKLVDWPYQYALSIKNKNYSVIDKIISLDKSLYVSRLSLEKNNINFLFDSVFGNIYGLVTLEISANNLSALNFLQQSTLSNLTNLDVSSNSIELIDSGWFKYLQALQVLKLEKNRLRDLASGTFGYLVSLRMLSLAGNKIWKLREKALGNLTKLEYLDLELNYMAVIEPFAFRFCASLKYNSEDLLILSITNQNIEYLKSYTFFGLEQVNNLDLRYNNIRIINNLTFYGMYRLMSINMAQNCLSFIDADGLDDSLSASLLSLCFTGNLIKQVNATTFAHLRNLKYLYLDDNAIEIIEPYSFLQQASSLAELYLQFNKIGDVRENHFSYLTALSKLYLNNNQISTIQANTFRQMTKLKELNLSNNCIFQVQPALLTGLVSLEYLSLSVNLLYKLNNQTFSNQTNKLTTLDLSYNLFQEVPSGVFSMLSKLKTLNLSNNQIRLLNSSQSFVNLTALNILRLSNNLIRELTPNSFNGIGLKTLRFLHLDGNQIESSRSSKIPFSSLIHIDLSSNQRVYSADILPSNFYGSVELIFRNMSSQFIQSIVAHIKAIYLESKISLLDFSMNDLRSLELKSVLTYFKNLGVLRLNSANMNISTSDLTIGEYLTELDLSNNPELKIVKNFEIMWLNRLNKLLMSNIGLQSLNEFNFSGYNYLTDLDLSRNSIEQIPWNSLSNIYTLKYVNLSSNKIKLLETVFIRSAFLALLDLSNNQLQQFQKELFSFFSSYTCVSMYLCGNNLTSFEYNSRYLEKIDLSQNMLTEIPSELKNPVQVYAECTFKLLNMSSNLLTHLKNDSFTNNKNLEFIYLANNRILYIEDNTFEQLNILSKLDLSHNSIAQVSSKTFNGLINLKYLTLSHNRIESFSRDTFYTFLNLRTLDLNNNKIKSLPDYLFTPVDNLYGLYINEIQLGLITNLTFLGLKSLFEIEINKDLVKSSENVNHLIASLKTSYAKKSGSYTFYYFKAIYFQEEADYDDRYCSMIIYFARFNLLLNPYYDGFVNCIKKELTNLDYKTVGLI